MYRENDHKPLILVTNDDSVHARGLEALIQVVKPFGDIVVVAPFLPQSGMSNAITITSPLRIKFLKEFENVKIYACKGTPVDCVKLSIHEILERKPDFVVSGINHGSNISISVIYSGTMGAVVEGCVHGIPGMGLSLSDYSETADFSAAIHYGRILMEKLINTRLPERTCLNVNIPGVAESEIKGIKICRQAKGAWKEEYDKRVDPHNGSYFWLTGDFDNFEPDATDTDDWAVRNNYVSVVPTMIDFTSYPGMESIKNWSTETKIKENLTDR